MIVISGTITIDPARNDRFLELTDELSAETAKEPGNVTYEYSMSPSRPGVWRVFEEWADQDALNAHMGAPHMAAFLGAAGEVGITAVDISAYEVSEKKKFM